MLFRGVLRSIIPLTTMLGIISSCTAEKTADILVCDFETDIKQEAKRLGAEFAPTHLVSIQEHRPAHPIKSTLSILTCDVIAIDLHLKAEDQPYALEHIYFNLSPESALVSLGMQQVEFWKRSQETDLHEQMTILRYLYLVKTNELSDIKVRYLAPEMSEAEDVRLLSLSIKPSTSGKNSNASEIE